MYQELGLSSRCSLKKLPMEKQSGFHNWVDTDKRAVEWAKICLHKVKNHRDMLCKSKKKSNLRYMCGNTPKRVTGDGVYLHGLAPGQHSSKETPIGWSPLATLHPI